MTALHFAPLQGYTDDAYRRAHHAVCAGVDVYYSPFVRWEHGGLRSKDVRDVQPDHNEGLPFVPQLIAATADEFARLADAMQALGYTRLDLNMGCPFPLQVRHGRGAGILAQPEVVAAIFEEMRQRSELQCSIKLRLGQTSEAESHALLPLINAAPLVHVALHPRLGCQQYKGTADHDAFARFAEGCRHPLIYNGDLRTPEEAAALCARFPHIAGLMIGRGLLARPTLAAEIRAGHAFPPAERLAQLLRLHERLYAHYSQIIPGESQLLSKLHTFWDYAEDALGRKAWKRLRKAGSLRNYLRALDEVAQC